MKKPKPTKNFKVSKLCLHLMARFQTDDDGVGLHSGNWNP